MDATTLVRKLCDTETLICLVRSEDYDNGAHVPGVGVDFFVALGAWNESAASREMGVRFTASFPSQNHFTLHVENTELTLKECNTLLDLFEPFFHSSCDARADFVSRMKEEKLWPERHRFWVVYIKVYGNPIGYMGVYETLRAARAALASAHARAIEADGRTLSLSLFENAAVTTVEAVHQRMASLRCEYEPALRPYWVLCTKKDGVLNDFFRVCETKSDADDAVAATLCAPGVTLQILEHPGESLDAVRVKFEKRFGHNKRPLF